MERMIRKSLIGLGTCVLFGIAAPASALDLGPTLKLDIGTGLSTSTIRGIQTPALVPSHDYRLTPHSPGVQLQPAGRQPAIVPAPTNEQEMAELIRRERDLVWWFEYNSLKWVADLPSLFDLDGTPSAEPEWRMQEAREKWRELDELRRRKAELLKQIYPQPQFAPDPNPGIYYTPERDRGERPAPAPEAAQPAPARTPQPASPPSRFHQELIEQGYPKKKNSFDGNREDVRAPGR